MNDEDKKAWLRHVSSSAPYKAGYEAGRASKGDNEWSFDMNKAPRDGTWFQGWRESPHIQDRIGSYAWNTEMFVNSHDSNEEWEQPIAWRELPQPPQQEPL